MNPGLFDMFHDARDMHMFAVGQCIDINLDRARQIAVQKHRAFARNSDGIGDVALQLVHVAHNLHRAAAQNIRGTDHQRKTDARGNFNGLRIG